ncbi:DinB family protein [Mycobacterium sp. SMC-21]|uniref:DinB family protein n=1 Tax=Mycobacterium sp. SMC-21 TaxID=3381632 RepID=UPI0038772F1D
MAGLPAPAGDERQTLVNFIAFQQDAFAAVAHGLTDEQARSTPSVSALSVGALIKHVTAVQAGWVARAEAAPNFPPRDTRPMAEQMADHQDQLTMRDDEKLGDLLDALRTQNAKTLQAFAELDLDALVPVPHEVPWFPSDIDHWTVRWVGMHIIEELSRHAGHADIIRESIDRATMYELLAAEEEWPETDFIKRWRPAAR